MMEQQVSGKLVHHKCGHPLLIDGYQEFRPLSVFAEPGYVDVLVVYRDMEEEPPIQVFVCPRCNKPLKLWWRRKKEEG
jgi:hypothetical protein